MELIKPSASLCIPQAETLFSSIGEYLGPVGLSNCFVALSRFVPLIDSIDSMNAVFFLFQWVGTNGQLVWGSHDQTYKWRTRLLFQFSAPGTPK